MYKFDDSKKYVLDFVQYIYNTIKDKGIFNIHKNFINYPYRFVEYLNPEQPYFKPEDFDTFMIDFEDLFIDRSKFSSFNIYSHMSLRNIIYKFNNPAGNISIFGGENISLEPTVAKNITARETIESRTEEKPLVNNLFFKHYFGNILFENIKFNIDTSKTDGIVSSTVSPIYYSCNHNSLLSFPYPTKNIEQRGITSNKLLQTDLDAFILNFSASISSGNESGVLKAIDIFDNNKNIITNIVKPLIPNNYIQNDYMLEYLDNNTYLLELEQNKHFIFVFSLMKSVLIFNKIEIFFCPINEVVWLLINNTYKIVDKDNTMKDIWVNIPNRTLVYDLGGDYLD